MLNQIPVFRISSVYFFCFAVLGALMPYFSLFLQQRGFRANEIGQIISITVTTRIFSPFIIGWLADHGGRPQMLIRISVFFAGLSFTGLLYQTPFLWTALITFGFTFFFNAALSQSESVALMFVKEKPELYSKMRIWGSIGYMVAVFAIGFLLDIYDIQYLPIIILTIIAVHWITTLAVPESKNYKKDKTQPHSSITNLPGAIVFLSIYFLLQLSHGPYYVFYSVFMTEHHYSSTVTGQLMALGVLAEILLFMFGNRITKLMSAKNLLLITIMITGGRWIMIAEQIDSMPYMIFAQVLHAVSFGLAHLLAIQFIFQYFGKDNINFGQTCYSAITFGLGDMIGGLISGYCWDQFGGEFVFTMAGYLCAAALLIAIFGIKNVKQNKISDAIDAHAVYES